MENFQNDCCRPWTKKPFKNSYSRQLRIVNARSVFLQTKATHFETMMTTVDEVNRDKAKVKTELVELVCLLIFNNYSAFTILDCLEYEFLKSFLV